MRRSPRRPLILRRRKLPFFQSEPMASGTQDPPDPPGGKEPSKPAVYQCLPDGIRIMDHPSMRDTQVVVIPKTADLQSVIGALSAKGKESGPQGRNKFILLSEDSGSLSQAAAEKESESRSAAGLPVRGGPIHDPPEAKPLIDIKPLIKDASCSRLDDSLTNIQWLGKMSTCGFEPDAAKQMSSKENHIPASKTSQAQNMYTNAEMIQQPMLERPPYSYMAMIQFAINSRRNRKMTLKEIYMWIEDNFPYYREVAKPGWKNSIRHNLSLHDMFVREASADGKTFFWTIRPEANRCLTLDQVYKTGCDSKTAPASGPMLLFPHQQQKRMDARKTPTSERKIKPLLPRTDSYLVPIQLPMASSVYLPTSSAFFTPDCFQQKQKASRGAKRVRIAPKVTQSNIPAPIGSPPHKNLKIEVNQEPICTPVKCETPKAPQKIQCSSSRRKQRLVHSLHEEPVLLCHSSTFFDSGVVSDVSTFQDVQDSELDELQHMKDSPDREFSFKTPIKGSSSLTSSTPSKPPLNVVEPWKVTPVGKGTQTGLEVSPIRTPGGPAVTPQHDYTTFSFSSTPFKDLPLFSSPRELLTHAPTRAFTPAESPLRHLPGWGATAPANRSITEGFILDTMNDSLSKILVDISFSGLDDEDLESANTSWSEFLNQFK